MIFPFCPEAEPIPKSMETNFKFSEQTGKIAGDHEIPTLAMSLGPPSTTLAPRRGCSCWLSHCGYVS